MIESLKVVMCSVLCRFIDFYIAKDLNVYCSLTLSILICFKCVRKSFYEQSNHTNIFNSTAALELCLLTFIMPTAFQYTAHKYASYGSLTFNIIFPFQGYFLTMIKDDVFKDLLNYSSMYFDTFSSDAFI